jgi:pimeloyl-ACP methyl ester carboxylesterase
MRKIPFLILVIVALPMLFSSALYAMCVDSVVLVHGNASSPSSWDNTYNLLRSKGYANSQIFRPAWGSRTCAACNNHSGAEEIPVRQAIVDAINSSCTGSIDVIGHSMGSTLAAQQISKLGMASSVDSFVGIAGAFRGLRSCGFFPFNVPTSTCGSAGLSVGSPFLDGIFGDPFGRRMYSIKSLIDQVVCSTGFCTVGGVHSSRIPGENGSVTLSLGHFGLQTSTAQRQYDLIR